MDDTEYYAEQAELCREREAASRSTTIRKHWHDLAEGYEKLAAGSLSFPRPTRRQPMQQQQSRSVNE